MKSLTLFALLGLLALPAARAQLPQGTNMGSTNLGVSTPVVISRDANTRVWARVTPIATNQQGQVTSRTNAAYTELAAGLHFWSNGWVESSSAITITPDGAAATNAAQRAWFPININTPGGIRLLPAGSTSTNQEIRSHVIGLSYATATTNVLFALLQDSIGTLVASNIVVYSNAFSNVFGGAPLKADVRYRFTGPGCLFEQDIVIREQIPSAQGLSGPVALQIWTEFIYPGQATVTERPGGNDQKIALGDTRFGPGRAFFVGNEQNPIPVRKQWVVNPIDSRTTLLEEMDLSAILPKIQSLPPPSGSGTNGSGLGGQARLYPEFPKKLPPAPKLAQRNGESIKIALSQTPPAPAFVADYVTLGPAGVNNYVFQGDSTYFIEHGLTASGSTVIEGGAVLKFSDDAYYYGGLDITGTLDCKTAAYRPACLTVFDDCTVGEPIAHATGSPATASAVNFLTLDSTSITSLSNLRFSYGYVGVNLFDSGEIDISNCQFVNCGVSIQNNAVHNVHLHNVLFTSSSGLALQFDQAGAMSLTAEQVTADCSAIWADSGYEPSFYLTNSIIVGSFDTPSSLSTTSVAINPGGSLFQTVGAGNYYLADGSPYRHAGTASLSASMLADLPHKTTSPPLLLTNNFIVDTTLNPQAQRETGVPSLGFLYDPIDYFAQCSISNATLTLTNGVAVAYASTAIRLNNDSTIVSHGMADARNYVVHYATVQEQSTNVSGLAYDISNSKPIQPQYDTAGHYATMDLQFTTLSVLPGALWFINADLAYYAMARLDLRHCEVYFGGSLFHLSDSNPNVILNLQNNIFFRPGYMELFGEGQATAYNNLFLGRCDLTNYFNYIYFIHSGAFTWTERDNAFDGLEAYVEGNIGHNAYLNGAINDAGAQTGDVTANISWATGPLGYFYQTNSCPLINAGSRAAAAAGLYHFTVRTDQTKDTTNVDLSYHYVALDGNNQPQDADNDGVPDYLENSSGGGTVVSGETDWQSATDLGLKVIITRPRNNSILP